MVLATMDFDSKSAMENQAQDTFWHYFFQGLQKHVNWAQRTANKLLPHLRCDPYFFTSDGQTSIWSGEYCRQSFLAVLAKYRNLVNIYHIAYRYALPVFGWHF